MTADRPVAHRERPLRVSDFLGGLKTRSLPALAVLLISQGGALVAMAVVVALYAVASTKGLVGVGAVLSSLYPVVTIVLGHRYLGERLGRLQPLGIAVALSGAAAIAASA